MAKVTRVASLHTFVQEAAFAHEDEGTPFKSPDNVKDVMKRAESVFPGVVSAHRLAKSVEVVLSAQGFNHDTTLLATSFCPDEVNRDVEDELRSVYGSNFSWGGIAGFPFGGVTSFGALGRHIPPNGSCLMVYGPHVGIDYDGVVGKVNRRGHHGSGACCNTAVASMAYVKAVRSGAQIHSPDPSDPIDAQQVFVDSALLAHGERLEKADDPDVELYHALFDCEDELLKRIMAKCIGDVPDGIEIALLGGIIVNTPEGTPDYFLPKKFELQDNKGAIVHDLLESLAEEGAKDPYAALMERKVISLEKQKAELEKKHAEEQAKLIHIEMRP